MSKRTQTSTLFQAARVPEMLWLSLLALATVVLTFVSAANAQGRPDTLPEQATGAAAIAALEARGALPEVAANHGMSPERLKDILKHDAGSLFISTRGELFYVDHETAEADPAEGVGDPQTAPLADTFKLHSKLGASKVIYLDFDGHDVSNSVWTNSYAQTEGQSVWPGDYAPAWSKDSDRANFSDTELTIIQQTWERMAEDFAPFDVDVTTEDPGMGKLSGDGTRVVFAPIYWDNTNETGFCRGGCGGLAYVGVFGDAYYQPALVFPNKLGHSAKNMAEAGSHEAGHNLGLSHDGKGTASYYGGHGSGATGWAPIMGVGYSKNLSQWSKGEYSGATQTQDDLTRIEGYIPLRADDHGDSRSYATALNQGSTFAAIGHIETREDLDYFQFDAGAGDININVDPAALGTNLDIRIGVYNTSGQLLGESNPTSYLNASLVISSATPGSYYLSVEGVGKGDPSTGYSDYGSLGKYEVYGTLTAPDGNESPTALITADVTNGIAPLPVIFDGLDSTDPDGSIVSYAWDFGDGATASGISASHTFGEGVFEVTLTVVDDGGLADTDTITIQSTPAPNVPPTAAASITSSGTHIAGSDAVQFSSAGSGDSDGTITYHWNFGDGSSSSAANPSHVYNSPGIYTATLTVTDNDGDSDSDTVSVTIEADPNFVAAPSNLVAAPSGSHVTLTWNDNSDNETGFRVRRGIKSKGKIKTTTWTVVATPGANTTTYTDSGVAEGTYLYEVQAFHATGESALSNQQQVKVGGKGGGGGGRGGRNNR